MRVLRVGLRQYVEAAGLLLGIAEQVASSTFAQLDKALDRLWDLAA